jgi:hypothetical protein
MKKVSLELEGIPIREVFKFKHPSRMYYPSRFNMGVNLPNIFLREGMDLNLRSTKVLLGKVTM